MKWENEIFCRAKRKGILQAIKGMFTNIDIRFTVLTTLTYSGTIVSNRGIVTDSIRRNQL
ncbi:hypothetical protein BTS2_3725 [Bacillus sp. TS-2]|nr:hypothetical protein BTS2_3725 [Bacillus sp. TS-2]